MLGFAFLVAVIALVVSAVLWFQWQGAASAVTALREGADSARKEAEAARAAERKAQEELKARSTQLVETRERLAETRKRAQEGKGNKAQPRGVREAELEADLAHARKLIEEVHAAESAARRDLTAARASEAQAKAEAERAQAKIRELASRPAPVAAAGSAPVAAVQAAPDLEAHRKQLDAARDELERQVKQSERNVHEAKRREQELRDEVRKQKGRSETNNRVYAITKGELELTKERLAQAERKLWQAGIALEKPAAKERPKATGPASADRPREPSSGPEATAGASPEATAGASAQAVEAGEPIGSGEAPQQGVAARDASNTPNGVAPIRRSPQDPAPEKTGNES